MVHTSYIQLYEGSTNQPLNWSFSLELETLLLATLSFDSSVIATIDPLTGGVSVTPAFTSRVNVTWVDGNVTLIILNVTSADEGVYSCELTGSYTNSWRRKIQVDTVGNVIHALYIEYFYSGRSLRRPILCGCPLTARENRKSAKSAIRMVFKSLETFLNRFNFPTLMRCKVDLLRPSHRHF